jgi:hypothetical protein
MKFPNWLKALAAGALLLGGAVLIMAPASTDDPPADTGRNGNAGGVAITDTIRTDPVPCFGAAAIVFAISATTGIDSATVLQVSQDNSHYFLPSQDGAASTRVNLSGYSGLDSLRNGPHTMVATYSVGDGGGGVSDVLVPFPYRYARLKVRNKSGTTITGLKVTAATIYTGASRSDFQTAYTTTW